MNVGIPVKTGPEGQQGWRKRQSSALRWLIGRGPDLSTCRAVGALWVAATVPG